MYNVKKNLVHNVSFIIVDKNTNKHLSQIYNKTFGGELFLNKWKYNSFDIDQNFEEGRNNGIVNT